MKTRNNAVSTLESRMLLHRFMCNQFGCSDRNGYANLPDHLDDLTKWSEQSDATDGSPFFQAMKNLLKKYYPVKQEDLARYDQNITDHSHSLGMTAENGRTWKPFQYLALLFAERYLDLYFADSEALMESLNEWKKLHDPEWRGKQRASKDDDYTLDDLRILAFQSATGSGKTLLLHANILQYQHYLTAHGLRHKLNKILLVTPDEGLSRQHLQELQSNHIPARLFSDEARTDIFARGGAMVDIIDIHKFAEKKGVKRVALEAFEENNLVMVDEGHLGSGGKKWRNYRKQIATNGFTFEYSATFNQAVAGADKHLRDAYGKAILFDYSYKFFYKDGYGKDYKITNLPQSDDVEASNLYLTACLLSFYQQCRIYKHKSWQWREFNLTPPLWVFLGRTVIGGGKADVATKSDCVRIILFLAWVLQQPTQAVKAIAQLVGGNTGLLNSSGEDIFANSFSHLPKQPPQKLYDDLCNTIFHAKGRLSIAHLTEADELQLAVADEKPFAVVNVGDTSGLHKLLKQTADESEIAPFVLAKNLFRKPLFAEVDGDYCSVNIVIGARKFIAGWNSWRVSTMGLMHVGSGEGPQIIQMFGRGVRLKGRDMSLKRHTALPNGKAPDSAQLKLLETLNIFGLKANYMDKFKEYLDQEGVPEQVSFIVPAKKQLSGVKGFKVLKKSDGVGEFQDSQKIIDLPTKPNGNYTVTLDRYSYLQAIESANVKTNQDESAKSSGTLARHASFLNKQAIYHQVLNCKQRRQWHNLVISQAAINHLLENHDWYTLFIPPQKLAMDQFSKVREWEKLAVDLICEYVAQYWREQRNVWEHEHLEIAPLDENHSNFIAQYELSVDKNASQLIKMIEEFVKQAEAGNYQYEQLLDGVQLSMLGPSAHAYVPLFYVSDNKSVTITPVALNKGEKNFIETMDRLVKSGEVDAIKDKDIYLMRNQSRGKGISFFNDYSFYPDFILWIKDEKRQDILFVDPKGLQIYDYSKASKVKLHERIKDTQTKIQQRWANVFLHSYVWSTTPLKNIGSDEKPISHDDWRKQGVYFADNGMRELQKLLNHALPTAA